MATTGAPHRVYRCLVFCVLSFQCGYFFLFCSFYNAYTLTDTHTHALTYVLNSVSYKRKLSVCRWWWWWWLRRYSCREEREGRRRLGAVRQTTSSSSSRREQMQKTQGIRRRTRRKGKGRWKYRIFPYPIPIPSPPSPCVYISLFFFFHFFRSQRNDDVVVEL